MVRQCSITECVKQSRARDFCVKHYARYMKTGSPYSVKIEFEKHGRASSPEYRSWSSMKQRCNNPKNPMYQYYGGRGIKVCGRWNKFSGFYEDMGFRPEGTTIERIDNNKGYSKENCKWATRREQSLNRRLQVNNRSGQRGVSWSKLHQKWEVYIKNQGIKRALGLYENFDEAVSARLKAESEREAIDLLRFRTG